MNGIFDSKRSFYYFVVAVFVLNLTTLSILTIFITNLSSSAQNTEQNEELKNTLENDSNSLVSKYQTISKRENIDNLRYKYNPEIQVADIIESIEKGSLTTGAQIANTEIMASTETEITMILTIEGSLAGITDFVSQLENRYLTSISDLGMYMNNQNYVLNGVFKFHKGIN